MSEGNRNQVAADIEAACDHDPEPEKYDVCIACADLVKALRSKDPVSPRELAAAQKVRATIAARFPKTGDK